MRCIRLVLPWLLSVVALGAQDAEPVRVLDGDRPARQQNWREAREQYERTLATESDWRSPLARRAVQGSAECSERLYDWDAAIARIAEFVERTRGHFEEAVGLRRLANAFQGISQYARLRKTSLPPRPDGAEPLTQKALARFDRLKAIEYYERARTLLTDLAASPQAAADRAYAELVRAERIGVNFDLAGALASSRGEGLSRRQAWFDTRSLEELDPEEDGDAGAPPFRVWDIPLDEQGQIRRIVAPPTYSDQAGASQRVLFLLAEIERLDDSAAREDAALAQLRRAQFYRSLSDPYLGELFRKPPVRPIEELADHETLLLAKGVSTVVAMRPEEDPGLLYRALIRQFPHTQAALEAEVAEGLHLQSRRQDVRALQHLRAFLARHPRDPRRPFVQKVVAGLTQPILELGGSRLDAPDAAHPLEFLVGNLREARFTAYRVDVAALLRARMAEAVRFPAREVPLDLSLADDKRWRSHVLGSPRRWTEQLGEPQLRVKRHQTQLPLSQPGVWFIEGEMPGKLRSRTIVTVSEAALLLRFTQKGLLVVLQDAQSGRPLTGRTVSLYEKIEVSGKPVQIRRRELRTRDDGTAEAPRPKDLASYRAIHQDEEGNFATAFLAADNDLDTLGLESRTVGAFALDRPVYRPGETVRYRLWLRDRTGAIYAPPMAGRKVTIACGPRGSNDRQSRDAVTDEAGGVSGEFVLPPQASLGSWRISVAEAFGGKSPLSLAESRFAVEEYRKQEFEVLVRGPETPPVFGEKFKATVEARYLFGAPVAQGTVKYEIQRSESPGESPMLDSTSGPIPERSYPWLSWSQPAQGNRSERPVTIGAGELALNADGTREIEVDPRLRQPRPDRTYRYRISVEVQDASRRVQSASGSVVLAQRQFALAVQPGKAWCEQPETIAVELRAATPDGRPSAANGELAVLRLQYRGPNQEEVAEETVATLPAVCGADGRGAVSCPLKASGQFRLRFTARDAGGQRIEANAIVWVGGPDFDGRKLRFKDLELITDRSSYRVGETAHVLVATRFDQGRVLFSDDAQDGRLQSWRFVEIQNRTAAVRLSIGAPGSSQHLEATIVRDGRVQTETLQLAVIRPETQLALTLQPDRPIYLPGQKGSIRLAARDSEGRPAAGEIVLRGWDDALEPFNLGAGLIGDAFALGSISHQPAGSDSLPESAKPLREEHPPSVSFHGLSSSDGTWPTEAWGDQLVDELHASGSSTLRGYRRRAARKLEPRACKLRFNDGLVEPARAVVTGSYIPTAESEASQPLTADSANTPKEGLRQLPSYIGYTRAENDSTGPAPERKAFALANTRSHFADTAIWLPRLKLEADGTVNASFELPETLTRWRLEAAAISPTTQSGEARATVQTTKNVLVRLQSPRFFIERDEVVVSSIAHNYLDTPQLVRAELIVPRGRLEPLAGGAPADGETLILAAEATVPAKGEHRFDWPLRALQTGPAEVVAKALTTEESDAVKLTFPVLVHGIQKQFVQGGSYRVGASGTRSLTLELPAEIDPEESRLAVTLTPSLAHVLVDALPFLAGYPYGCVEQTMSRFFPTAIVNGALKRSGTDLAAIGRRLAEEPRRARQFGTSPVFDAGELERMTRAGLKRIAEMQQSSGGWGWWSADSASIYQTAYVLHGLKAAQRNGVDVDNQMLGRGYRFLAAAVEEGLASPKRRRSLGDETIQAFVAYVLTLDEQLPHRGADWLQQLFHRRENQTHQGRALLALVLQATGKKEQARLVLHNLLQFVQRDDSNETSWIRTPQSDWWYWWKNDIETNAWTLRALVAIEPKSELAPRLVKWLVQNRHGGGSWRSTRDTALAICAIDDYLRTSGEGAPDLTASVSLDGASPATFTFKKGGFAAAGERVVLSGSALRPGSHTVSFTKQGRGALYYSARLEFFTRAADIQSAGGDLAVERSYFKLVPPVDPTKAAPGTLTRVPLAQGDAVRSGEQIEVLLQLKSKNTYDYLAFEDRKPAGFEPIEIASGSTYADGFCANVELRDAKVVFFVAELPAGERELRYRLRAEVPGTFRAPPATGFAMYAPELKANSRTMRLKVE